MSRISLSAKPNLRAPLQTIDASTLRPDNLCALNKKQIASLTLTAGMDRIPIGDLFTVRQSVADKATLTVGTAGLKLEKLGAGMKAGELRVAGNAGTYLGYQMRGGLITANDNAQALAGCAMRGGKIHIRGNAGERAGGSRPGHEFGMRGGVLQIDGDCGSRAGDRMRRGILLIGGNAADQCAHRILAGTIIVMGNAGRLNGFEMRHGSLILLGAHMANEQLDSFADTGRHPLIFVKLLARTVRQHRKDIAAKLVSTPSWRRLAGDLAAGGRGEILRIID